jgi:sugar O-acyltransferase (sialic acid O-acetyltransferase NeuD family)
MAEPLVLVTASGLAREALAVIRTHGLFDVVGIVDDDEALHGTSVDGVPVLGPLEALAGRRDAQVLVCAGKGRAREAIVDRLDALGVGPTRYATLVHPGVEVPDGCAVGDGSIVLAGVVLTTAVTLGVHVVVMPNVTLTHDCVVQDFGTLCAGVALGGGVVVGRGAYVGMNAGVREHRRVGAYATVGMGAVLLRDAPDGETWAGVPARPRGTDNVRARHRVPADAAGAPTDDEGAVVR